MEAVLKSSLGKIVKNSSLGGGFMGVAVTIDRILEDAGSSTIISAGSKQALSTFIMAASCLCVYDIISHKLKDGSYQGTKKIILGVMLSSLSGVVNNIIQKNTLGSVGESVMISGIALTGLAAHEFDVMPKIKGQMELNKYQILKFLTDIGNTTGLK